MDVTQRKVIDDIEDQQPCPTGTAVERHTFHRCSQMTWRVLSMWRVAQSAGEADLMARRNRFWALFRAEAN
ncbi:unnamed protein product [Heligmosomoides polygyrus]|uniref:DUF1367 family protein n=1 Tax=Heligmosomoides polygyrus TaxID=6339 RepID=A0A183G0J1_HELPZ|nr:unnamed protein product [Heligmosomoides polygyrus]